VRRVQAPTPDLVRFEALVEEYKRDYEGMTEQEKARKEEAIRVCAPPEKKDRDTSNAEDWLGQFLPYQGIYDFTLRKRFLGMGDSAKPVWEALERGMYYKHARKCLKRFTDKIQGQNGISKSEHPKILQKIIEEVWDGTTRRVRRPVANKVEEESNEKAVLKHLERVGAEGATDPEIEADLKIPNARQRRVSLVRQGLVCDSGRVRTAPTGRLVKVWVVATSAPKEPTPKVKTPKFVSAHTEAVQALRDSFVAMLAALARGEAQSSVGPMLDEASPWMTKYIIAMMKEINIPEATALKKVQQMRGAFESLLNEWASELRTLRHLYEATHTTLSAEMTPEKWAAIQEACECFHIDVPADAFTPINLKSAELVFRRKIKENHPDHFHKYGPEVVAAKDEFTKIILERWSRLQRWNDRLELEADKEKDNGRDVDTQADADGVPPAHPQSPGGEEARVV
jgi:hypothetical protein